MSNNGMNVSNKEEERKKEPLQTGTANSRPNSHVDVVMERPLTVNVFFDGTGNNRHNTEARLADEAYGTDQVTADWKKIEELEEGIKREDAWRKNYPDSPPRMSELEYKRNKSLIEQYKEEFTKTGYDQPNHESHTHLGGQVSYGNEFTNVALLFLEASEESDPKIYIEGAGTSKHNTDDIEGLGLAAGKVSGVEARVNEAFIKLKEPLI